MLDQKRSRRYVMGSPSVTPQSVKIQEGTGPLVDRLPFDDAEYRRRLDGVRAQMAQQGIEAAGGHIVDASQTVEGMRVIKSSPELAYIRAGARALERAMQAGFKACRVGTNENELAAVVVAELIRNGAEYAGLPPFIT